jgi:CheY-like chemotaxis protein
MSLRILVVEDHAPFRQLVCASLKRAEYQIVEAADGLEAVQKLETLMPDVILLDIHLPKMNGFEVAKHIHRLSPSARLIFMSQESAPEIVRKALNLGGHGYIQKSSAGTDLLPAIDAVLAGRQFLSRSVAPSGPAETAAPRRHDLVFCSDDAGLITAFAHYVAAALNAADGAVVLVTESHRLHLLEALRTRGVDIDGAIGRGTFRAFDADAAPVPVQFLAAINQVRAAAAQAGKARPRVACCGEAAGRLWAAGKTEEAVQLEQFGNDLPPDVDILCAYPVPHNSDDRSLTRICAAHTAVSTR